MKARVRSVVALALGTATAAAAPANPVVRVFVAGAPDAVSGTRDALRDRCARSNLVIVVEDASTLGGGRSVPSNDGAADGSTWGDDGANGTSDANGTANGDVLRPNGTANGDVLRPNGAETASNEALALGSGEATDLAVGYVALEPAAESRVVLVDGQTHEELERRVLEPTESFEMSIETVAHVICATIDSTLATRLAPPPPIPPPAPIPDVPSAPPRAPSEPENAFGGWAAVFGTGADYGAGFRGGGGGLLGATTGSSRFRASLLLLASDFPSLELDRQGAHSSFGLFGARLLPGVALRAADDIDVLFGVGPGIDWLRVAAGTPPPDGTAQMGVSTVDPVLSALLGTRLRVGGHVGLWLAIGADLDAYRHRYVNAAGDAPVVFFEMPRLRGSGQAGLTVTFGREGLDTRRSLASAELGGSP